MSDENAYPAWAWEDASNHFYNTLHSAAPDYANSVYAYAIHELHSVCLADMLVRLRQVR